MSFSRPYFLLLLLLITAVQAFLLLNVSLPLGVPGEWTWPRIPAGQWNPEVLILACSLGGGYLWYWQKIARHLEQSSRTLVFGKLLLLWLLACGTFWTMRGIPQGIYGHSGLTWVTFYPRMSGYFTQAAESQQSLRVFLADYEEQVRTGDYLHQGTHPPGLPLYFRAGLTLCRELPWLNSLLLATEPVEVAAGTDVLQELAVQNGHPFPAEYRAVLWGNVLFTSLFCLATLFPLYGLLRQFYSAELSWRLCGFWPFLPGLCLFLPKSDLLLPFFSALVAYCYVASLQKNRAGLRTTSLLLAVMAGFSLWLSLQISLAMLVVLVILSLWTVLEMLRVLAANEENLINQPQNRFAWLQLSLWKFPWGVMLAALAGVLLPCVIVWAVYDLNLLNVWQLNLKNHARFYDHNPRTYWLWLLINPLELAGSLGGPVFLLLLLSLVNGVRRKTLFLLNNGGAFSIAVLLIWGLLWLSGKNMGEAARLWIFLFPLLLTASTACFQEALSQALPAAEFSQETEKFALFQTKSFPWRTVFLAQFVICLLAVTNIDSFDFSYFLK